MESSPRGLWRLLGVQVWRKPSWVRIPHSPPKLKFSILCKLLEIDIFIIILLLTKNIWEKEA